MGKINEMDLLLIKRDLLIEKQKVDLESLKFQFDETRKVMSLTNIIKSTFVKKNLKENLINIALGFATNYVIDKFPFVSGENKLQKILNQLFKLNK
jgi:hypothetical protein